MKTIVASPTSGRMKYFVPFIESIAKCRGNFTVLIVPEFGVDSKAIKDAIPEALIKICYFQDAPLKKRFSDAALIQTRNIAFEEMGADQVLLIDDDVVVTPGFVERLIQLNEWASSFGDHIVQSSIDYIGDLDSKIKLIDAVQSGFSSGVNTMMSRAVWMKVKPVLDEYVRLWADGHQAYQIPDIRKWWFQLVKDSKPMKGSCLMPCLAQNYGVACDAALEVAACVAQVRTARLCVNRAVTIGVEGANFNQEVFDQLFKGVTLDDVDEPGSVPEFYWYPQSTSEYYQSLPK